jgi:voltage-gated potassium channel
VIIPNLRILRLVRVERYANTLGIFRKVIVDKSSELLTSLSLMVSTIFIVATTIYYLERDLQPEKLSTLFDSTYFTVITLATIGN